MRSLGLLCPQASAWLLIAAASCTSAWTPGSHHNERILAGTYNAIEPRRPGTLRLTNDHSFTITLPTGLLDDGTPFLAEGQWRPVKNRAPADNAMQTVAWLEVSRWGPVTIEGSDDIPLYADEDGLALMSPCMTWVFQKKQ